MSLNHIVLGNPVPLDVEFKSALIDGDLTVNGNIIGNLGGLFTPILQFGGASVGMTGTFKGKYVAIGNLVNFGITIQLTNKGSSTGTASISGLPILPSTSSVDNQTSWVNYTNLANVAGSPSPAFFVSIPGAQMFIGYSQVGGSQVFLNDTNFTNTSLFSFSGHYFTN